MSEDVNVTCVLTCCGDMKVHLVHFFKKSIMVKLDYFVNKKFSKGCAQERVVSVIRLKQFDMNNMLQHQLYLLYLQHLIYLHLHWMLIKALIARGTTNKK